MNSLVILSRIENNALMDYEAFKAAKEFLCERLEKQCPDVSWRVYYPTLGEFDVVNLLSSEDYQQLLNASRFIQSFQGMRTDVVFATCWEEFDDILSPAVRGDDSRGSTSALSKLALGAG